MRRMRDNRSLRPEARPVGCASSRRASSSRSAMQSVAAFGMSLLSARSMLASMSYSDKSRRMETTMSRSCAMLGGDQGEAMEQGFADT